MTDLPPSPVRADPPAYPGAPRWVKVLGMGVAALVLLFVVLKLLGFEHGPGRHMKQGSTESESTLSDSVEDHASAAGDE